MRKFMIAAAGFILAAQPVAALAADWWWVAGDPGSSHVYFVDADSISAEGADRTFRVLHLSSKGTRNEKHRRVDCRHAATPAASAADAEPAITRFVCATADERLSIGAMLGDISPEVTANIIFETPTPL